jgi:anti-anti-sigma factor
MHKILVVDDEKSTLGMFHLFLSAYGYTVLTAENGTEGLQLFEKEKPPIVITDIKMPGVDGIELLRRIKEMDEMTEVIMITGHGDMELAVKALDLNATDFINKPIQRPALDAALKRAEYRLQFTGEKEKNEIHLRTEKNVTIMDIQGNVTSRSESFLSEAFEKASAEEATQIVVSFNENCSINGGGIAILIQLLSNSQRNNLEVAITGLSDNFKKVFEMVGITKFARIFDNQEDAIKSFS